MSKTFADISISLDGFVAGPNPSLDEPLGEGGEQLHEWALRLASFRQSHGLEGGERGADDDYYAEVLASTGAYVMGRLMFSGGEGPWADLLRTRFEKAAKKYGLGQAKFPLRTDLFRPPEGAQMRLL